MRSNLSASTTPKVTKHLTGDAQTDGRRRFDVVPGEPVIVREERVEVHRRRQGAAARRGGGRGLCAQGRRTARSSPPTKPARPSSTPVAARLGISRREIHQATRHGDARRAIREVDLHWESGPRYKFGDVRFSGDAPFPEEFLHEFVPWREGGFFNSEQVLNLQQRLVDADYFELVSVQPALDEKKDGTVPIDVLLNRDERTVYSGEVYYSTDFGAGVRLGAERRWLNKKGHKADVEGRVLGATAGSGRSTTRFRGRAATTVPTISVSAIATKPPTSTARATFSSPPRARRSAGMASRARSGSSISTAISRSARTKTISSTATPNCCLPKAR